MPVLADVRSRRCAGLKSTIAGNHVLPDCFVIGILNLRDINFVRPRLWPIAGSRAVGTLDVGSLTVGPQHPDSRPCSLPTRHLRPELHGPISKMEGGPLHHPRKSGKLARTVVGVSAGGSLGNGGDHQVAVAHTNLRGVVALLLIVAVVPGTVHGYPLGAQRRPREIIEENHIGCRRRCESYPADICIADVHRLAGWAERSRRAAGGPCIAAG